jgi:hypothetical protein
MKTNLSKYGLTNDYTGQGNDQWTPAYAVRPLLPYLERFRGRVIWCPADTEESQYVQIFKAAGHSVVYSHIRAGQDFYKWQPERWDMLITNPPFKNKANRVARTLSFNKPFALLMPVQWINDTAPVDLFDPSRMQLLIPRQRINFIGGKGQTPFKCVYYCYDFLPHSFVFCELEKNKADERVANPAKPPAEQLELF